MKLQLDENKFEKIVNNLLSNALKFTPSGETVTVDLAEFPDRLLLSVSDTGPGIHADDLPHVFDRFYQANRADTPASGGTGIGLSLSHEFAKLMGGRLWAESTLGQGSQFYFEFPKKEVVSAVFEENGEMDGGSEMENGEAETVISPIVPPTSNATLLIVEDNPEISNYLGLILGEEYKILHAENGQAALDCLLQTEDCQLVITDLMMPIMDGFQLMKKLKADERLRQLPVIMLTARADIEDRLAAFRFGVDDYIVKPFLEEEIKVRVANLLQNARMRKQFEAEETSLPVTSPPADPAEQEWLKKLESLILEKAGTHQLTADFVAAQMFTSRTELFRRVKKATGLTPTQFAQGIRLQKARRLLETGECRTVKSAAHSVGYRQVDKFTINFKKQFGKVPSECLV